MSMAERTAGRVTILLVAGLLTAMSGLPAASASSRAAAEQGFVDAINRERKAAKLGQLVVNSGLSAIAHDWSGEMATSRQLRHNGSLRTQIERRVTTDWARLGENVGYTRRSGATDAELVQRLHQAFMDSKGHRANILGNFNQLGVGVRRNSDGTMWVTVVFLNGPLPRQPAQTSGFRDVSGVHAANVTALTEAGVARGFGDGLFRPTNPVTRGQMATFIAQAKGLPGRDKDAFRDAAEPHRRSINALAHAGITSGYPDGTYRPGRAVTRGQMAGFLVAALDLRPRDAGSFSDTAKSTFRRDINALAHAGITGGFGDGTFRPDQTVTREQMATFLVQAFKLGR